jgi:hypothetical protein
MKMQRKKEKDSQKKMEDKAKKAAGVDAKRLTEMKAHAESEARRIA